MSRQPYLVLLFALSLLTACRERDAAEPLSNWLTQARHLAEQGAATLPEPQATAFFPLPYLLDGNTTPFGTDRQEPVPEQQRPPQRGPRQPLEDFALEALRLMGTLSRGPDYNALVLAGTTLYRVRVGDYLGPRFGRVQRISAHGLELQELLRSTDGGWRAQQVLVPLPGGPR